MGPTVSSLHARACLLLGQPAGRLAQLSCKCLQPACSPPALCGHPLALTPPHRPPHPQSDLAMRLARRVPRTPEDFEQALQLAEQRWVTLFGG